MLVTNKYGLHSLRSGGATRATNFGFTDRLFKRHGRWRSETAKDGYVKDALQIRLSVLQCLGLLIFENFKEVDLAVLVLALANVFPHSLNSSRSSFLLITN